LSQSTKLTNEDLVEIANAKGQMHLAAIAGRASLDEAVTDVLVARGDLNVRHKLAANAGARLSEGGYLKLVDSATKDEQLAKAIGLRIDLPLQLLRTLLEKAALHVREWLLASAPPGVQDTIRQTLHKVSGDVAREVLAPCDFTQASRTVEAMKAGGKLNEGALLNFATVRKYEEMVAALAALCSSSVGLIAPLVKSARIEGLLVACKAGEIKWPTVSAILQARIVQHVLSDTEILQAKVDYLKLSTETARRTLRFWAVRAETR
jgi:uncharacterized protein (DUF2336 family)